MAAPPPLLAVQGVTVTFGGRPLFENVDLALTRGDKLCLVGRNASGKSTLLRVLAGGIEPDAGLRVAKPGLSVGVLDQDPDFKAFATVQEFVAAGLPDAERADDHRVAAILERLGLAGERDPATLSGGKMRRAALARALIARPDVLLLDEPTNHLDLPAIQGLEEELEGYRGALLMISHDRAFLNRLGHRTLWLDRGRLRDTGRPFSGFEAWQEEAFAAEEAAARKMDARIASELLWMREGLSARRKRNMGRVRALDQMRSDRAERLRAGARVRMNATEAEAGGRVVIEADGVSKSFETSRGRRMLVNNFSTRILRGDRIGIIGPNGAGKTTLIRLLTGELAPDSGTVKLGSRLELAYFDQRRQTLDPEATLKQTLCPSGGDTVALGTERRHVASYLKDFLFESRQIEAPVKTLSGGERNRLLLARLFARPSNCLVLDEPTNDLDMETLDVLEELLGAYPGTLLMVSHDRDFLDRLVTSTIVLEGDGTAAEYPGGYTDYLTQRPAPTEARPTAKPGGAAAAPPTAEPKAKRKLGYQQQRELERLPAQIETLTRTVGRLEAELSDPALYGRDPTRAQAVNRDLDQARKALAEAEDRWLELEALREIFEAGA